MDFLSFPLGLGGVFGRETLGNEALRDAEELSERQVRCHWPTRTLTLPVAFRLDVQRSQVRRRRRQSLLELRLAAAEETDLGLRDAVVQRGWKRSWP